jgi:hypothetical protein
MHVPLPPLLDVVAPALPLAQALGRWGNYFNQELFGLPTKLPWAVRITNQAQLAGLPQKYQTHLSAAGKYLPGTFQPTFLYESIWDLAVFGLLLLIERQVRLRRGYLFAAYAALYTLGRFWTEYLRIDPAHRYLGLRLNDWTSVGVFAVSTAVLLLKGRPKPGDDLVGDELPPEVQAEENARALKASTRGTPESYAEPPGAPASAGAVGPDVAQVAGPGEGEAPSPPTTAPGGLPSGTGPLGAAVEATGEAPPAGQAASAEEAPAVAADEVAAVTTEPAPDGAPRAEAGNVAAPSVQETEPEALPRPSQTSATEGDEPSAEGTAMSKHQALLPAGFVPAGTSGGGTGVPPR